MEATMDTAIRPGTEIEDQIFQHFSRLFRYPDAETADIAADCYRLLKRQHPEEAEQLQYFKEFVAGSLPAKVEETFTATFELQPLCHPYVGYQLCGESGQRTMFLIKLKELYRQNGYTLGHELPDHFSEMLGFVATIDDPVCRTELVTDALIPALDKLIVSMENEDHPYRRMLVALRMWLGTEDEEKGVLS